MDWVQTALDIGFSHAALIDVSTLEPQQIVRDACAADKCHMYNKNWTCPPACGPLEECAAQMGQYTHGVLLQTVGELNGPYDVKGMESALANHLLYFHAFAERIRTAYPDALCLGAGGCQVCKKCAYPEPCRFPEKAYSSMEAYGLFVTRLCKDNGLAAYYGKGTLTYVACALYKENPDEEA